MSEPIVNPEIPYVGEIPGGLQPGKMIRIQGVTHPHSDRFNINLATGPNVKPRDDTGLHLSVRLNQGYVARNTYKDGAWGDEQGSGKLPIGKSQSFEIILLIDPSHYKIAINGQHFAEFPYRVPFHKVSYLLIDGEVSITLLSFEGVAIPEGLTASQASAVHAEGPQGAPPQFGGPQYGPQGGYGPPPPNYGGYGPPPPPGATPGQLPTAHINPVALSYPINIKPGVIPPLPGQTQSYGHLQPIPAQTYGHSQPIPAKTYGHLQPIPAKTYEHSQPIPAQTYGQSQPVLAQTYGRPQPILAQTYGHPQQMPPQSYGHQPPIPSQSYGHSHPIPPQSYGHQPPIPSQSYGHSHPIPPQSYGNPQPGTHPSFGHSQVGTQHSLGHHLPGQLPYPVQHTSETARAMYPVQPIGFAGYPFPALGHSKKIKKPKKAKKASKKHHKHKSSSSSSSSSSDSN